MASFTLTASHVFPQGTTVGVFPPEHEPAPDRPPTLAQVTSGVVGSDGRVTFTGLDDGTRYVAYAVVAGRHRYVGFATPPRQSLDVRDNAITELDFDPDNVDGLAAVPSLRTLGTGPQQAAPGDDARFTGTRTYYVSPSGSDANSGTSPDSPWQTVAKVNAAGIPAGATVLFEGGQTAQTGGASSLIAPAAATSAKPVTFGSYGTGRAVFSRSTAGSLISGDSADHIVVQDIEFRSLVPYVANGITLSAAGSGCSNWKVRRCKFVDLAIPINSANTGDDDAEVGENEIENCGDSAIICTGDRWKIETNRVVGIGKDPLVDYGTHGVYLKGTGHAVRFNHFEDCPDGQGVSQRGSGNVIEFNRYVDCRIPIAYFAENAVRGTTVIRHNTGQARAGFAASAGIYLTNDDGVRDFNENFDIEDNTLDVPGSNGITIECRNAAGDADCADLAGLSIRTRRNTVRGARGYWLRTISGGLPGTHVEDDNVFDVDVAEWRVGTATYSSFGAFKAGLGGDSDTATALRGAGAAGSVGIGDSPTSAPMTASGQERGIYLMGPRHGYPGRRAVVANQAQMHRFVAEKDITLDTIVFSVAVAAGSDDAVDVGLYDADLNRIVSSGAVTGQLNSAGAKLIAVPATTLRKGTVYYVAIACGAIGTGAASIHTSEFDGVWATRQFGDGAPHQEVLAKAASHPLPASLANPSLTFSYGPWMSGRV